MPQTVTTGGGLSRPTEATPWDGLFDRHVSEGNADRVAFRDPWRSLTYGELATDTARFAGALSRAGIRREQRVLLLLQDTIDFPVAFWGTMRAGAVPVPDQHAADSGHCRLHPGGLPGRGGRDVGGTDRGAGAGNPGRWVRHVIVSQPKSPPQANDFATFLAGGDPDTATVPASPDEVAFWLYSSGSTGAPKGVRHVHSSLRITAETYGAKVLEIRPDDVMFSAAKAFHAYGLGNSMTFPMSVGATAVFLPGRPTPAAVQETMRPTIEPCSAAFPPVRRAAGQP